MPEPDQAGFWNARCASDDYLFGTQPNAFLAREVHRLMPKSRVFAVADGVSRNSVFLAQHGHRVVATDVSQRALDKALSLAERQSVDVEFLQADLSE